RCTAAGPTRCFVSCLRSPSVPARSLSGTDAEEWWTSTQVVDAAATAGGGNGIRGAAGDTGIHVQGDIAWTEGRGRFTRADGAERPVRVTGVLVREDGRWKVVQSHASIGVPNADIFG